VFFCLLSLSRLQDTLSKEQMRSVKEAIDMPATPAGSSVDDDDRVGGIGVEVSKRGSSSDRISSAGRDDSTATAPELPAYPMSARDAPRRAKAEEASRVASR
jgi:hypothetical protein